MYLDTDLTLFTKINSKRSIDPNVESKTIKFLEGSIKENQDDPGYGGDFLDIIIKAWAGLH